jgi:hypothetical protein
MGGDTRLLESTDSATLPLKNILATIVMGMLWDQDYFSRFWQHFQGEISSILISIGQIYY